MCTTCDHNPCLRNCPEAHKLPPIIGNCEWCCEDIYEDEEHRVFNSDIFVHEGCLSDMRGDQLADLLNVSTQNRYKDDCA